MAHGLEELLDLDDESNMEDGRVQFDMAKVAGADLDVFFARRAVVHAVDGTKLGVV